MRENPDIPVQVTVVPVEAYDQKVTTSIGGGASLDIFNTGEVLLPSLVSRNSVLDLNAFVERDDYPMKGFFPEVIDGLTVQGKLVGLSDNWDTQVMYYNRDLFDAAGLDYPDETWDWNDFVDAARKLSSGSGIDQVFGAIHEAWFVPLWDRVWSEGGEIFNDDATECLLDQPESVKALQALADLYEEDISPSQPELDQGQDPLQLFVSGRAAMWIGPGRWAAYDLQDADIVDWAIAPKPAGSQGHPRANFFHLSLYAIASSSDNPDNAWKFLQYMVSPEGMKLGLESMQGIPAREKIARSPEFTDDPFVRQHDAYAPFIESLETVHTAPYLIRFDEAENAISAGLDPVWRGERTAEEATARICDEVDQILAEEA